MPLIDVVAKTLKYVKDEALNEINKCQLVPISDEEILWIVTVPAIWSDIAKVGLFIFLSKFSCFPGF